MPIQTKISHYNELLAGTVNTFSKAEKWQAFLETSARLYKYKFSDQAMIHAQRPNATACADFNLWGNPHTNRHVRRGSKGIALIDHDSLRVKYVFDYADTEPKTNKHFKLWQINEDNENTVVNMLKAKYGAESDSLDSAIFQAAKHITNEQGGDWANELVDYTEGSFLEDMDSYNVWAIFSHTLENSIAYGLLARCGYDPADYFTTEDFEHLWNFNTPQTMTILGRSVSELSEHTLRDIERTVKSFEKSQERKQTNERVIENPPQRNENGVQIEQNNGAVLPAPANDEITDVREVRTNESELPQTAQAEPLRNDVNNGDFRESSDGNKHGGEQAITIDDVAGGESSGNNRSPQSREPDRMGGVDEQPQTVSGGNYNQRADIHLTPDPADNGGDFFQKNTDISEDEIAEHGEYSFKVGDVIELETGVFEVSSVGDIIEITDTTTNDVISVTEDELYENGFTVLDEASVIIQEIPETPENDTADCVLKIGDIIETDAGIFEVTGIDGDIVELQDTATDERDTVHGDELRSGGFEVIQKAPEPRQTPEKPETPQATPAPSAPTSEYDIDPLSLIGKHYDIGGREFVVESVSTEANAVSFMDVISFNNGLPLFRQETIDFLLFLEREERQGKLEPDITDLTLGLFTKNEPEPIAQNFKITDFYFADVGAKTKFDNNIKAIKLLKEIEGDFERLPTPEEQEILAKYVGWGGLSEAFNDKNPRWENEYAILKDTFSEFEFESAKESTLNAHYTSPTVIQAIYEGLENMGFKSGNVLEPSMGVGNFFGMLPDSMSKCKLHGVELDDISGRIAKQLYPNAKIKDGTGFEDTDYSDNFFDVAVGNVPFGGYSAPDKRYDKLNLPIHDYFFAKSLDKVRPGGVVAFVTSKGTLDKQNSKFRKYLAERADLIGAIRLPNTAFKSNAGTEVTSDIIFLQKRDRVIEVEPEWTKLGKTSDGLPINKYFVDNPDMVLGNIVEGNKLYGEKSSIDTTCIPFEGTDLSEQLKRAIANIKGDIPEYDRTDEKIIDSIPADESVRNFSFTVVDDKLFYRENSRMNRLEFPKKTDERIKAMVKLRDCVRELIDLQLYEYSESDIASQQVKLNILYDSFSKKHGLINSSANRNAFKDDSGYYLLCSLEVLNEQGELERKADMFTKRTIKQRTVITSVDTASEALAVSIAEKAKVDLDFMSELSGLPKEQIVVDLHGVIYQLPFSESYVTADEYLSGNIREKLIHALQFQNSLETPAEFADNVESLKQAMPKPLEASDIDIRLGVNWVEPAIIKDFISETLQTAESVKSQFHVRYSEYTGEWGIEGKNADSNNALVYTTYGTARKNAYALIEDCLNQRDTKVYDKIKDKSVLNKEETMLAQGKQDTIKQAFKEWIFKDPDRRQELVAKYNELFNSSRPREYDGKHIEFVGMNPEIKMNPHQRNAVAHALYGGNTLFAHCVGAGKTYEMVATAMESKRLGLCNKSLIVVPNHISEQFGSDFQTLYPSANILVATKKDFETKNRRRLCAKIATGDYDAVIIGHSQLEKIPISQERQERLIRKQIRQITNGIEELKTQKGEKFNVKQLEKTKKNLQAKLKRLTESPKRDNVVTFEELGIDKLFIDEADLFKNLYLYTKMRNVAGVSQTEAQKSTDLYLKTQYLDELTGGKGTIFATGTPISNSMTEMYTMQRYLQSDTLRKQKLEHFDCWAAQYGETITAMELAPEGGGYRARTRFAKFFNLPELMNNFKEAADIKTADMLPDLKTPKVNFHNVAVEPTQHQKDMVADLSERAVKVQRKEVEPHVDNMLCITNDGRKIGLDQRLLNPLLPDEPGTKVNACIDNVHRIWNDTATDKSTQMIFCDFSTPKKDGSFNVYDDIRDKLIKRGIPKKEIAFIHEYDSEEKKKELFAKVRKGDVRVLLGSTAKMGAGTNVQDKLIALHDLDAPWRPRDLEQRSGRIVRQGNLNPQVDIFRYVTEGTFDAYLWQTLECKQRYISQIMTSKSPIRSCEDVDEITLSYAEIKALCAGNPLIKEKMDLEVDVSKLRMLKANHRNEQYRIEDRVLKFFPESIRAVEKRIEGFESDVEHLKSLPALPTAADGTPSIKIAIMGTEYTDKESAGNALIHACSQIRTGNKKHDIGEYKGFNMSVEYDSFSKVFVLELKRDMTYTAKIGTDVMSNITRINQALDTAPRYLESAVNNLGTLKSQLATAKGELGKPFPKETELETKTARLNELNILLNRDEGKEEVATINKAADKPLCKMSITERIKRYKQKESAPKKERDISRNLKKDNEIS